MVEIWSNGKVVPAQVASVRETHATDRDGEPAESGTHHADGEFAESEIDDGNQPIIQREQLSCKGLPRLMPWPSLLDLTHRKQLTDDWSTLCVVCKVNGKKLRNHHHWSECDSMQGGKKKMNDAFDFLHDIKFDKFVHCKWCYRPQVICEISWNRRVNQQGLVAFNKQCQAPSA
ncbi:hypothetical protein E4U13_000210 [Claviceps humidiphila]|uniref:Uncharacterized protein n=1 Tax=Claviceps humidiphila TaxID=1294629 RepID=A0A9P7PV82_9HYPO|nr:hypothetical protein E4U13_000210 [Claviceps humidiphila]